MKATIIVSLLVGLVVLGADSLFAAERAKADVSCDATDEALVYDCKIKLTGRKSGAPIDGAKIVINADMPSMAMAHNVRPVEAKASGMPGMYTTRIRLDMMGEWALRLDISGPMRDRVIVKRDFGKRGSSMAAGGMKHGKGRGSKMSAKMKRGKGHGSQMSGKMNPGRERASKMSGSMNPGKGHASQGTHKSGSMNPCSSK